MIRRPPRSTLSSSSAASDVYKRQDVTRTLMLRAGRASLGIWLREGQRCPKCQDEDVRRTRAEAAPDARVLRGAAARGRVKPGWEAGRCQRRVLHYRAR